MKFQSELFEKIVKVTPKDTLEQAQLKSVGHKDLRQRLSLANNSCTIDCGSFQK
jgi:hypothetical protein